MKYTKLMNYNLNGKTIAISGSTGGIGCKLCEHLLSLGADLVLVDRNLEKSQNLSKNLKSKYKNANIDFVTCDMEIFKNVIAAVAILKQMKIDVFIHNAGAYKIPRKITDIGFDNIFQINFVSPYYITKELQNDIEKFVVVGSIAHNYSKIDTNDIDFRTYKACSKVYGNAKRFLMFSLFELFKNAPEKLTITHPGITFTNITAHYPKLIFAIIKYPMKVIFMKPKSAALCILEGVFKNINYHHWIGPRLLNVWGKPTIKKLSTCTKEESIKISKIANDIYDKLKEQ